MKIDKSINIQNIVQNCKKTSLNGNQFPEMDFNNITELPSTCTNEIYFKSVLQKQYSIKDIIKLLDQNDYVNNEGNFSKKLSQEERLSLIFTLYPQIGQNYENDKNYIDNLINNEMLYNQFLKYAATSEYVCNTDLTPIDIDNLCKFANLAKGKVGKFIEKDFDYTLFIFKLMKHNNLFDRFMTQAKQQPVILEGLLQILQNKPSIEEFRSLNDYKSISAFAINADLRCDKKDEEILNNVNNIDTYMNKWNISSPLKLIRSDHMGILYSLISKDKHFLLEELKEAFNLNNINKINKICEQIQDTKPELINKGYISTSLDKDMDRDIKWNLTVMPNVNCTYVDLINALSYDTSQENEVLIQRNTKFKVTNFKYEPNTKQFVIDADVYPI